MRQKLTEMKEWKALQAHFDTIKNTHMRDMFAADKDRVERFSFADGDILFDYSKNRIDETTMKLLLELADARELRKEIDKMFNGEKINETENRAVLHIALRNVKGAPVKLDGHDVMFDVNEVLEKMHHFSDHVRCGAWKGFTGKPIKNIVNIGIGGSDLGPVMVTEALKPYAKREITNTAVAVIAMLSHSHPRSASGLSSRSNSSKE